MNYKELDRQDPLAKYRAQFSIPKANGKESIYLCGNSLGLRPEKTVNYVNETLEAWAELGVEGHTEALHPWLPYHEFLTNEMAKVAGAPPKTIVVMNSLSVNLHLLMVSFYRPRKNRFKILIEKDAFPSDQYAVASQARFHGYNEKEAVLKLPLSVDKPYTTTEDVISFIEKNADELALVMLGGVNYYSGYAYDFKEIAAVCQRHGIIIGFDMAHAAGNVEMNLGETEVDFACWCSYKYLNSGPGSLSGVFINQKHLELKDINRFEGWWGHNKKNRFEMPDEFDPIPTAEAWQLSNPPILPMACIKASLEIFEEAGMKAIREKSVKISQFMIELLLDIETDIIDIITPLNPKERGAQISIRVKSADKKLFEAISSDGVIADWREPDVIRVAAAPLYNSYEDVYKFVNILNHHIKKLNL